MKKLTYVIILLTLYTDCVLARGGSSARAHYPDEGSSSFGSGDPSGLFLFFSIFFGLLIVVAIIGVIKDSLNSTTKNINELSPGEIALDKGKQFKADEFYYEHIAYSSGEEKIKYYKEYKDAFGSYADKDLPVDY